MVTAALKFLSQYTNYIIALVIVVIVAVCGRIIYQNGKQLGVSETMLAWQKQEKERNDIIDDYRTEINDLKVKYEKQTVQHKMEITAIKVAAENDRRTIQRDYADRLLNADKRAGVYKRLSQSGESERIRLAEHAAKLDRSVEEGRSLLKEQQSAIAERDGIIGKLVAQLRALEQLNNSAGTNNESGTSKGAAKL